MIADRAIVVGDIEKVDQHKARKNDKKEWVGGIAFERSHRALGIQKANRSFPHPFTFQAQRNMAGIAAGMKTVGFELDDHLVQRQAVGRVSVHRSLFQRFPKSPTAHC